MIWSAQATPSGGRTVLSSAEAAPSDARAAISSATGASEQARAAISSATGGSDWARGESPSFLSVPEAESPEGSKSFWADVDIDVLSIDQ